MPRWLLVFVVCLVATLWGVNVVVGLIDPARAVPGLNAVFGSIVGAALLMDKPISSAVRKLGRASRGRAPGEDEAEEVS